jgi:hypothetical protein
MYSIPDMAVGVDKPREEEVQVEAVQDLVLLRMDPTSTKSREFADVHGTVRIPDNKRVRRVLRIEIEREIDWKVETRGLEDRRSQGRYLGSHVKGSRIADRVPVNYTTNMNASVVSSFGKSE